MDVDAVTFRGFDKIEDFKNEIQTVAGEMDLSPDWINPYFGNFAVVLPPDYVERLRCGYLGKNLEILVLGPEDLLIMKLHAGRPKDDGHVRRLLKTQEINLKIVEAHLETLIDRRIPNSKKALDRLDDYLEDLGLDS